MSRPRLVPPALACLGLIMLSDARGQPPQQAKSQAAQPADSAGTEPLPVGAIARLKGVHVSRVALSPDGKTLVAYGLEMQIWNVDTGKVLPPAFNLPEPETLIRTRAVGIGAIQIAVVVHPVGAHRVHRQPIALPRQPYGTLNKGIIG